jgi:hypothetical protein
MTGALDGCAQCMDGKITLPHPEGDHGEQGQPGEGGGRISAKAPAGRPGRLVGRNLVRRLYAGLGGVAPRARLQEIAGADQFAGQIGIDQIAEHFSMALAQTEESAAEATVPLVDVDHARLPAHGQLELLEREDQPNPETIVGLARGQHALDRQAAD